MQAFQPASCRAGCGQQIITPPVGVSLAGYFHVRVAEYVRDELYARAVVLESQGHRLALISCDLISLEREIVEAAKLLIEQETGIRPEQVLICATHTHTGPELRPGRPVPRVEEWVRDLPRRLAWAVQDAAGSMFEATLHPGRTEVTGYSFNRLFRLKDATEVFGQPAEAVGPAGPIDPELQTLSLVDREGRLRGLLVHFALHVDVIGGGSANFISADWPGELARNIAAVYGQDVVTLFLQGTCGDINHHPHNPTCLPRGGPRKAVQLGRALSGAAMCAAERAEPMNALPLGVANRVLSIPYYTRDASFMAELQALKARPQLNDFERYLVEKGESWPYDGQCAEVPVQVMRIGEVALVGLPAEIFVRLGLEIKRYSPAASTFVVELANASVSTYVSTTDQAERGAYGARPILSRWLAADAGRRMTDAAQVMLWQLWS